MVLGSFFVCHSTHVIEAPCECYNIWSFDEFFFCCPCTWSQFLCKRRAKAIKLIVFMAHNWSQKGYNQYTESASPPFKMMEFFI